MMLLLIVTLCVAVLWLFVLIVAGIVVTVRERGERRRYKR